MANREARTQVLLMCAATIVGLLGMHALTAAVGTCHSLATVVSSQMSMPHGSSSGGPELLVTEHHHRGSDPAGPAHSAPPGGELTAMDAGGTPHDSSLGLCVAIIVVIAMIFGWRRTSLRRFFHSRRVVAVLRCDCWPRPPPQLVVVKLSVMRL